MTDVEKTQALIVLAHGDGERKWVRLPGWVYARRLLEDGAPVLSTPPFRPWSDITDCGELARALRAAGKINRIGSEDCARSGVRAWVDGRRPVTAETEVRARFDALGSALLGDGGGEGC